MWLMVAVLLAASLLRLPQLQSTPPGLHYDEAANATIAADIGLRGERPIFIESYTGKEVLFFYVAGAMMRAMGASHAILRLSAAFLGLLTVAATYWLGRELLADRRVAVVAAALIAVSFWHLVFSRLGFRAISQPLLQALTVAALFRGLRYGHRAGAWRWYALSGLFLGLTGYTYLAARIFPLLLLLALVPVLASAQGRQQRWSLLALTVVVALVVLSPLLNYFSQHPEAFWVRIAQVAADGPAAGERGLLGSYMASLGMFFLSGDPYWRFNLPGRPLFDWFWGGLLVVGWLAALIRWRRWWYPWQKAAVALLILVPFLMILPTALATGEIVPSNLRTIGLLPFITYLPALGLVTLVEGLAEVVRGRAGGFAALVRALNFMDGYDVNYAFIALLILLLGGFGTWRLYFEQWATRADLFYSSDGDLVAVARYLDEEAPPHATLFVSALHHRHPTLAFLSENYERVRWITESGAFVRPAAEEALYIFPRNSPLPQWMAPMLATAQRTVGPPGPDGAPLYEAYLVPSAQSQTEGALPGTFGDLAQPLWVHVADGLSGQQVEATFAWRVLRTENRPYRIFAQLTDLWGNRWGQSEALSYATDQWQPEDEVLQRIVVPVAPGTPPGSYRLHLGFFLDADGSRLERRDELGRYAGDALVVESVAIAAGAPPAERPQPPSGRAQDVGDGLELLGYTIGGDTVETGATLPLTLWWWATAGQPPMSLRLELLRGDNTGVILLATQPVQGTYPFESWQTPLFLRDVVNPRIPLSLAAGVYRLHLRILDEAGGTVFTTSLGTVDIEETVRLFEAPDMQQRLAALFEGEIELAGYTLEQIAPVQYRLQLIWQALRPMDRAYTVFVHLLRPDGSCCVWQADQMPQQGRYPTSRWLQGEYVVDEYIIAPDGDLAAGQYGLEIGLYIAETGRRLVVRMPGHEMDDALRLPPIELQ